MSLYYKRTEGHQSLWIQQIMSYAEYCILRKFENHRKDKSGSWKLTRFSCYQYLHVFSTPFSWVFRFSVYLKFYPKLQPQLILITKITSNQNLKIQTKKVGDVRFADLFMKTMFYRLITSVLSASTAQ